MIILAAFGELASAAGAPQEAVLAYPLASDYINITSSSDFEKYGLEGHGTPKIICD